MAAEMWAMKQVINQRDSLKQDCKDLISAVERVVKIHDKCRGEAAPMHAAIVDAVFDFRELLERVKRGM